MVNCQMEWDLPTCSGLWYFKAARGLNKKHHIRAWWTAICCRRYTWAIFTSPGLSILKLYGNFRELVYARAGGISGGRSCAVYCRSSYISQMLGALPWSFYWQVHRLSPRPPIYFSKLKLHTACIIKCRKYKLIRLYTLLDKEFTREQPVRRSGRHEQHMVPTWWQFCPRRAALSVDGGDIACAQKATRG